MTNRPFRRALLYAVTLVAAPGQPGFVVAARPATAMTPAVRFTVLSEDGVAGATSDLPSARELRLVPAGPGRVAAFWRDGDARQVIATLPADLSGGVAPLVEVDGIDPIAFEQPRTLRPSWPGRARPPPPSGPGWC